MDYPNGTAPGRQKTRPREREKRERRARVVRAREEKKMRRPCRRLKLLINVSLAILRGREIRRDQVQPPRQVRDALFRKRGKLRNEGCFFRMSIARSRTASRASMISRITGKAVPLREAGVSSGVVILEDGGRPIGANASGHNSPLFGGGGGGRSE